MGFTQQNATENKAMKETAERLVVEVGYDPAKSLNGNGRYNTYYREVHASIKNQLQELFPEVKGERVNVQTVGALRRAYGRWVRARRGQQ